MAEKVALFAFKGETMCFAHALLNALDMYGKGMDVRLVIEGTATGLVAELNEPDSPFSGLYEQAREKGLIDCVCRACAHKTGALDSAKEQGLRLRDEMSGHPSMSRYTEEGYAIITL
jgi:hypothetical protein